MFFNINKKVNKTRKKIYHELNYFMSKRRSVENLSSLCLMMGPYRNLSTLTSSILFFHPNCQILNHAGERIYGDKRLDFLYEYNNTKFDNFVKFAVEISSRGERGPYGGSITMSHAFDSEHKTNELYKKRKTKMVKENIKSIVWKEPQRNINRIKKGKENIESIVRKNEKIRFLLPIRNPLDCTRSNIKTGAYSIIDCVDSKNKKEVLRGIMKEILRYAVLSKKYPQQFFHFFEHSLGKEELDKMESFLCLEKNRKWKREVLQIIDFKSKYSHEKKFVKEYIKILDKEFNDYPSLQNGLYEFVS